MNSFDPVFFTGVKQADHQKCVYPSALQFRHNSTQVSIDSVKFPHRIQQMDKSKREELSPGFLNRSGQGRHCYRKADHLSVLIQNCRHKIRNNKTKILFDIGFTLFIRQINHTIKWTVGSINDLKEFRGVFKKFFFVLRFQNPQFITLF